MCELRVSKDSLDTVGTGTLIGHVVCSGIEPGPIRILFEQTSGTWKAKNDGPDEIIVPEYVIPCLCDDLVRLIQLGYEVSIGDYVNDPS